MPKRDQKGVSDSRDFEWSDLSRSKKYSVQAQIFWRLTNLANTDSTLVICTRNREDHLERLLNQVSQCAASPELVVIVDSSEEAWTRAKFLALEHSAPFKLHYLHAREGLPYQRNVGLAHLKNLKTKSPVVHFLDDDVEIPPNFFSVACDFLKVNPGAVAVGAYDCNLRPPKPFWLGNLLGLTSPKNKGSLLPSGIALAPHKILEAAPVTWLPGFGMSVRYAAVQIPGSIWDSSHRMYGEDVSASLRLGLLGQLWVIPEHFLVHKEALSGREALTARAYFSDGFRMRLTELAPNKVRASKVMVATLALLIGECLLAFAQADSGRFGSVVGHARFLNDWARRKLRSQLVTHDFSDLSPNFTYPESSNILDKL